MINKTTKGAATIMDRATSELIEGELAAYERVLGLLHSHPIEMVIAAITEQLESLRAEYEQRNREEIVERQAQLRRDRDKQKQCLWLADGNSDYLCGQPAVALARNKPSSRPRPVCESHNAEAKKRHYIIEDL